MSTYELGRSAVRLYAFALLILGATTVRAASTDVCSALFKDSIVDKEDTYTDKQKYQQTKSLISSSQFESYSQAEQAKGSLGIDIFEVIDVALGGKTDSSNYGDRRNEFLQKDYSLVVSNATLQSSVRRASQVIATAAIKCIDLTSNINGFTAWIVPSKSLQSFTVNTRYINVGGGNIYTINSLSISPDVGARCDIKLPEKVKNTSRTIACQKPANATVQVSLNTTAGSLTGIDVGGYDDLIGEMRDRLSAIESGGMLVPRGAVSFFNSTQCPSGWREVERARGRYVVGLSPGGHLSETQGVALKDLENRPTGNHTHKIGGFVKENYFLTGGSGNRDFYPNRGETQGPKVPPGMTTADGTNAPYVQFLACERQ